MKNITRRALLSHISRITMLTGVAVVAGCGGGAGAAPGNAGAANDAGAPMTVVNPGQLVYVLQTDRARTLLARMTLEEKVGQMMQVEHSFLKDPGDIDKYHLGSLLSGGGSGPSGGANTVAGWAAMIAGYQNRALGTRLKIPLLYGIDAVHGNNNVPGSTIFPHNIGLGATRDPQLVRQIAQITAQETRAIGANWAFAPCVAVPQDVRWGRTYEGFSQDPNLVRTLAAPAIEGLQGQNLTAPDAMLACAKHFIGDGGTAWGTSAKSGYGLDQGDTRLSLEALKSVHMAGYQSAIAAGVGTVMPSYSSWNGVKCSASKPLLTGLLKGELGFAGIVISDYDALDQLGSDYKNNIATSINAGMDMVMMTDKYPLFYTNLIELVRENKVPLARVDDAVTRILRVKATMGLLDENPKVAANAGAAGSVGSAAHREVARQAVRESLVLLKNQNRVLPLSKTAARIAVSGSGADDTGRQCGGWTLTWQGQTGNVIPGATSILSAIKQAASPQTEVVYARDGQGLAEADVNVVVVSETPYAEWFGDARDLSLAAVSSEDATAIARARATGKPVVLVIVAGRPLVLGDASDQADAIIAAWLPGTQGQGVADVLFGDYNPTGKLPVVWPRTMAQLPINATTNVKPNPQFDLGFGLNYAG